MKTHLPHRLRAALMAALAFVSLTSAYGAAPTLIKEGEYAIDWSKVTLDDRGTIKNNNVNGAVFCPTAPESAVTQPFPDYKQSDHALYRDSASGFGYVNVVRRETTSTASDFYLDMQNVKFGESYGFSGIAGSITKNANIYVRAGQTDTSHKVSFAWGAEGGSHLIGNVYMELADSNATYTGSVYGANASNITESSTLVIRDGKFDCCVTAGIGNAGSGNYTIGGGSYLQIEGGTFQQEVVAGSIPASGTATITGGTNMLINGGTFKGDVIAGSSGKGTSEITGGTHLTINGGTFNGDIYGASKDAGANCNTIEGGVNITINGGTFNSQYILGCGNDGREIVHGGININISGNTSFQNSTYTGIYAQGRGCDYAAGAVNISISGDGVKFNENASVSISAYNEKGTSSPCSGATITLADLTNASDFAKDTKNGVSFYIRGLAWAGTLELSNVNADFKKDIMDFSNMVVKNGSHVTLDTEAHDYWAGNKTLGGAKTVTVENGSTLTSEGISVSGRDEKGATITKDSSATLATATKIQDAKVELAGTASINTQLENVDLVNAKAGTTLTVNNISGTQNTATVSSNATVNLVNIGEGKDGILKELNISGEGKLGVYINGTAAAGENDAYVGNLTLASGGKITIGQGGGTLEANLSTQAGSILDFSAGATLTMGCELNVGASTCIVLSGEDYDSLLSGGTVTLFNGVDNVINADKEASTLYVYRAAMSGTRLTDQVSFYTDENKNAVLTLTANVPEPTTGTLSLLALAGLAARRRRKH